VNAVENEARKHSWWEKLVGTIHNGKSGHQNIDYVTSLMAD
jgi:hypothetical protein